MTAFQIVVLSFTNPSLKDTVCAQQNSEDSVAGRSLRFHLPARIADEHDLAILLEQCVHALVIGDASIGKPDEAIRIEIVHRQRFKNSGDCRG